MLGRASDREVVLALYLLAAFKKLILGLPDDATDAAMRPVVECNAAQSALAKSRVTQQTIPDATSHDVGCQEPPGRQT